MNVACNELLPDESILNQELVNLNHYEICIIFPALMSELFVSALLQLVLTLMTLFSCM